jgi:UDP-2,3-diacylglucosamine hydrolase
MKLAFISDLHLSPRTTSKNKLFYSMLAKWQTELDGLYILGDFFDYWVGDDDNNHFIREIKIALSTFTHTKPIFFIRGNHDFALGQRFARETGITILPDCSTIKLATDLTILLSHGDVFCTLDLNYQKMKKIIQNPIIKWILLQMPLSWRYKFKDMLEKQAGAHFNTKHSQVYRVVDQTVIDIAHKHKAHTVIHGHTHNPGKYVLTHLNSNITRFEIPDWESRPAGGYILFEHNNLVIF